MNAKGTEMASNGGAEVPWSLLAELGRLQLAIAAESTSAVFRAREVVRAVQQQAAHEASVRHAETARKLRAAGAPSDVLALQSELIRDNLQAAGQYWQQLAEAAAQTQFEMMASMSRLLDGKAGTGMKSVLQALQAAIPTRDSSFFSVKRDSVNGSRDA